jgi:hypothetical protein
MRSVTTLLALAFTAGCFPGLNLDVDEIADVEFAPTDAFHFEENDEVFMMFAEYPGLCERLVDDDSSVENLKFLLVVVGDIDEDGTTDDVEPGNYEINEQLGKRSAAIFGSADNDCFGEVSVVATGGEVVIDSYDRRGAAVGSLDIEIDGDDVSGTFRTAECDMDLQDLERDPNECDP